MCAIGTSAGTRVFYVRHNTGMMASESTVNFVPMIVAFIGSFVNKASLLKSIQLRYSNIINGSIGLWI